MASGQVTLLRKADPSTPVRVTSDWSRDGRLLIYTVVDPKTRADIWYAPIESGTLNREAAVKVLGTDAIESQGQLSPDGKWLAYTSNEAGPSQVYVRSFPAGGSVWKVSDGVGAQPRWSATGRELYFTTTTNGTEVTLMTAAVDPDGQGIRIGAPQKLFGANVPMIVPQQNIFAYSPHPDGKRFLVNLLTDSDEQTVNVITHWWKRESTQ
jgi:hypothetical protein